MLRARVHRFAWLSLAAAVGLSGPAWAIDEARQKKADAMIEKSIVYLRAKQDTATGGWAVPPAGSPQPAFPAITGLVVNGLAMQPNPTPEVKAAIEGGARYILSMQKPDGGIYDALLPSYNTAISLSALARVDSDAARAAIKPAQDFLRNSQWGATTPVGVGGKGGKEAPQTVDESHPFFGGLGYGNRGRPDISNTQFMLEAFKDTGVPPDDPAVKRAIVFLTRCQMNGATNPMEYASGSRQGGFIYATGESGETAGKGQSFAGTIEETLDNGEKVSKLRAYGSVSYAGFKSYIYAQLKKDDPRVVALMGWLSNNYTLAENPGIGKDGQYYYYIAFARALDATGTSTFPVLEAGKPAPRDWQNDLVDQLATLQNEDGSFKSTSARWMEDNPVLITAYALVALQHAARP
jgi:squalene-hopene/tetraprenyl-beta-curcumene cyclase